MRRGKIYDFGAIGGPIGARLTAAGYEVSAIARGETLAALRTHGAFKTSMLQDAGIRRTGNSCAGNRHANWHTDTQHQ